MKLKKLKIEVVYDDDKGAILTSVERTDFSEIEVIGVLHNLIMLEHERIAKMKQVNFKK